jgi:hypothetical protein
MHILSPAMPAQGHLIAHLKQLAKHMLMAKVLKAVRLAERLTYPY